MDPFAIVLFVLGVVGVVWVTLYAYFEYHAERAEEWARLLEVVATEEVFEHYVRPLLVQKLLRWEGERPLAWGTERRRSSGLMDPPGAPPPPRGEAVDRLALLGDAQIVPARRIYAELRRTLLLTPREFETYVDMCVDALRRRHVHTRTAGWHRRVEDACAWYVWRNTPLDDMCLFMQHLYAE